MASKQKNSGLRVLYVAIQDLTYPRNRRLRRFLSTDLEMEVDVLPLSPKPGFLRHNFELIFRGFRATRTYDVVVLAEFSVPFAFAAWVLAKRHRGVLVVDFFVGLFETQIGDRGVASPRSFLALAYRFFDRLALSCADIVVCDTQVRAEAVSSRLRGNRTAISLPVGAPSWARPERYSPPADDRLRLLYYGNYVPLHGVETLIDAIKLLRARRALVVTMVGGGQHRQVSENRVKELGLDDIVHFREAVPEEQLMSLIAPNDIILGIFGESPKASSVIANKVWQGLASGKIVVTRATTALCEIEGIVGQRLVQVPAGDAASVANAIEAAGERSDLRASPPDAADALEAYVAVEYRKFGNVLRALASRKIARQQGDE